MLAAGVSFRRLMRPYMISCVLISTLSFFLSAYIIPHGTVVRQNFETMYKNCILYTSDAADDLPSVHLCMCRRNMKPHDTKEQHTKIE